MTSYEIQVMRDSVVRDKPDRLTAVVNVVQDFNGHREGPFEVARLAINLVHGVQLAPVLQMLFAAVEGLKHDT